MSDGARGGCASKDVRNRECVGGKGRVRGGAGKARDDVHLCKIISSCAMCMRI